jgi:hypothetical protein
MLVHPTRSACARCTFSSFCSNLVVPPAPLGGIPLRSVLSQCAFKVPHKLVIGLGFWASAGHVGDLLLRLPYNVSICWFEAWPDLARARNALAHGCPDLELDDFVDDAEYWHSLDRAAALLVLWWTHSIGRDANHAQAGEDLVTTLASSCLQNWDDMDRAAYYYQCVWRLLTREAAEPRSPRAPYANLLEKTSRWANGGKAVQLLESVCHFKENLPLLLDSYDSRKHHAARIGRLMGRWMRAGDETLRDDMEDERGDGLASDDDEATDDADDDCLRMSPVAKPPDAHPHALGPVALERRLAAFEYFFDEWPAAAALRETRRKLRLPPPCTNGIDDEHPSADWRNLPRVGQLLCAAFGAPSQCPLRILDRLLVESACAKHVARVVAAWQDAAHEHLSVSLDLSDWADEQNASDLLRHVKVARERNAH